MKNLFFYTPWLIAARRSRRQDSVRTVKKTCAAVMFAGLGLATFANVASSATANGTLSVSASIISSCRVTGATLDFGNINPITASGAINSSVPFLVKCTNGTPYTVAFDDGTHKSAGVHTRNLQNATGARDLLPYQVYLDIGRTAIWGTGTGELGTATGNGMDQTVTLYAQIPNVSTVSPGTYSDALTLTVTY